jgi:phosphate transport system substrate-binding protein
MKRFLVTLLIVIPIGILVSSCGGSQNPNQETTTSGNIRIGVDDSYRLLLDTEIATFQSLYPNAKINPEYGSEGDLMQLFMKDSLRAIITSRELNESEKEYFKSNKLFPKVTKICVDGLAFIVNRNNLDSTFSYNQLKKLFTTNPSKWSDIKPGASSESVQVVFDSPNSGNARYLRELFQLKQLPSLCTAVKSNEEVVNYVETHPGSMGVISSNWISDVDDSVSGDFLKRIRVVGVSSENDPDAVLGYTQPYQGYLADKSYPFRRDVYYINREIGTRLGTGFASFVAGDKGQRIVLKSGLVPAYGVIRLIDAGN